MKNWYEMAEKVVKAKNNGEITEEEFLDMMDEVFDVLLMENEDMLKRMKEND